MADLAEREPTIVGAHIVGGHDGSAELLLRIRYENGVIGETVIDNDLGIRLIAQCENEQGSADLDVLIGQSWRQMMRMLKGKEDDV